MIFLCGVGKIQNQRTANILIILIYSLSFIPVAIMGSPENSTFFRMKTTESVSCHGHTNKKSSLRYYTFILCCL